MSRLLPLAFAAATLACSTWRRSPPPAPPAPTLPSAPATTHRTIAGVPLHLTALPRPGLARNAAIGLSLRLGSNSDPIHQPGISALLLALLRGHDEREGSLAAALGELGGTPDLSLAPAGALLSVEVPAEHAPAALRALLTAIRRPLDPADFPAVAAEQAAARARARDDPDALALAGLRRLSFPPGHPHAASRLSAGTWSFEHVLEHSQRALGPAVLAIVVAGDLDPAPLTAAASDALTGWTHPAISTPAAPAPASPRRAIHRIARPGLAQAVIAIGRAADLADNDLAAQVAAVLVQSLLGERLRGDMAATYGVAVTLEPARGPGLLHILTQVDAPAIGPTLAAIHAALTELQRLRPEPDLVARVCVHEALDRLYQRQTDRDQLHALARAHWYDRPPAAPQVCPALASAAARRLHEHFAPDTLQIVVVGDPALVDAPLAALQLGPVLALDPATL